MGTRIESDSMGTMEVPSEAYYGASTARAQKNFPISGKGLSRRFIKALGAVKLSAARVNQRLGLLESEKGRLVEKAAQEVMDGTLDKEFVVDVFQTGSGTSTNMNANEVISNRASELMGGERGSKLVHPNDHVNYGQSSNDVIPTAMHLSAMIGITDELIPALKMMQSSLEAKSKEFWEVVKTGRTHLQDATPIRLGQVFLGFAGQIERSIRRLEHALVELGELPQGGTAVGTGINTHKDFGREMAKELSSVLGVKAQETTNHFQAQNTIDAMIYASGSLRTIAMSLHKIANDIRFMGSGPRAGYAEIKLPEVQPGSSIMPGKINPVIAESLIQVTAQVMGNDQAILHGGYSSYFELNVSFPMASSNFDRSVDLLSAGIKNFTTQCIDGLEATEKGPEMVEQGLMLGTALAPVIGYDKAAKIAKQANKEGRTIRQVTKEVTELSEGELQEILDPLKMTQPVEEATMA